MIQQKIKDNIKETMKAKDEVRLSVMRGLSAGMTNELVAKGHKPTDELSDDDALVVIKRQAKQRKDSIEQFRAGGREDLASGEEAELAIIEEFLPDQMSEEEIKKIAEAKIAEFNSDKSKLGIIVGAVMKETKGTADGALVKQVVERLLL